MLQTIIHSTKFQILSIFLLALVLRLFYLAAIRDAPYFHTLVIDAFEYDHLATQILRGNWLLDLAEDMYVHGPSTRTYSPCSKESASAIWAFSCSKPCWARLSAS